MPDFSGRGFAQWAPTRTDYGRPKLWLWIDQPAPKIGSPPELLEAHTGTHMTIEQAEEIHLKLGEAIKWVKLRDEEIERED